IQWHAEPGYERYWHAVERLMELCPPAGHARVLDYGCGVGDSALRFARAGYDVTIADVPGRTLDFARAPFARRRVPGPVGGRMSARKLAGCDKAAALGSRKMRQRRVWQRRVRYHVWQRTGWFLHRVPRFPGDDVRDFPKGPVSSG